MCHHGRHGRAHAAAGTSRPAPRRPEERVGDAERTACQERLAEHFAAGRLTDAELEERTAAAARAQTRGDLATLEADLPRLPRPRLSPRDRLAASAACHAWWAVPVGLVVVL